MSKQKLNLITIILFFLILLTPFVGGILGADKTPQTNENRKLASFPNVQDSWNYLKKYQSYFDDHSTFRSIMVKADHEFKINALNISPNPSVSLGKNDWLFYTPDETLIDTINGHPFSSTELEEISKNLQNTQNFFNSQNINFYFIVAPNSQTIYSEFLPQHLEKVNPKSRLEQITEHLKKSNSNINFINPVPELKIAKSITQLYRKFDTHWNDYGAYITYHKLLTTISRDLPNIKPLTLEEFDIKFEDSKNKDLEILVGLPEKYNEQEPYFYLKQKSPVINIKDECSNSYEQCAEVIKYQNNPQLPNLLMFRDSFGVSLIPYIANNFQTSRFLWKVTPYSLNEIEKEKPEVVIVELTERELWRLKDKLFNF